MSTRDTRIAFDELQAMLGVDDSIDADDPLWIRLAEVDIELQAAESTGLRSAPDNVLSDIVRLKLIEIDRQLSDIARDVLGYYALVKEPRGANEPPVGGERARLLRSRFLDARLEDELESMRLRQNLFRFLEERSH